MKPKPPVTRIRTFVAYYYLQRYSLRVLRGVETVEIPVRTGVPGSLGVIEFDSLDFVPQRLYWLAKVQPGEVRGNHAHKQLRQLLILISGSVTVEICRGRNCEMFELQREGSGLKISPGLWRNILNFSENAVIGVLCDSPYDEGDYIRDYEEYVEWFEANHA
jgi:hypothetical protein